MPVLPALAAALLAAAPPVPLDLGGAPLPLGLSVEVRSARPARAPDLADPPLDQDGPLPLAWSTAADGALTGRAVTADLLAEVRLAPAPGGARRLEVTLR